MYLTPFSFWKLKCLKQPSETDVDVEIVELAVGPPPTRRFHRNSKTIFVAKVRWRFAVTASATAATAAAATATAAAVSATAAVEFFIIRILSNLKVVSLLKGSILQNL